MFSLSYSKFMLFLYSHYLLCKFDCDLTAETRPAVPPSLGSSVALCFNSQTLCA
jgi:hypothetical protein